MRGNAGIHAWIAARRRYSALVVFRTVVLALVLLAACEHSDDVVGPFTGETRRFVVDAFDLPTTNTAAHQYGGFINGDNVIDNQLGLVLAQLAQYESGDLTTHGREMINAGVIASSVLITADDFANDPSVSVLYLGHEDDGSAVEVGGRFVDGELIPNRTQTTSVPGAATLHLPVFVGTDPSVVDVIGLEIELTADDTGGFRGELHGVVAHPDAVDATGVGMADMIAAAPADHVDFIHLLDQDRDGVITPNEVVTSSIMVTFLSPDVMYDGVYVLSIGFRFHLTPCPEGRCEMPMISCFNRVRDGDEIGIDCGGACALACR